MAKLLSRLRYKHLFFGVILICGFKTVAQPTLTFSPTNGATNVAENVLIKITSNEDLSRADNTALSDAIVTPLIKFKITNAAGADIPFTAVFVPNREIQIQPNSILPSNTIIYVEIKDLQGSSNIDMSPNPQSFTFTTGDTQDPIAVFNPLNNATNVSLTNNLTITFNEAIRNIDNSPITAGDLSTLIELKLTDNSGATEPITASIDGTNKIITINPTSNLQNGTLYYFEINSVEDAADNDFSTSNITFTTVDLLPPVPTFTPLNGTTGVNESANIVIDFDEPIRRIYDNANFDDNTIDAFITLKLTNAAGADIPFDATINGSDNQVTIDPTSALPGNSVIYVAIDGVEDNSDNLISPNPTSITFTTGDTQPPSIIFNPSNSSTNISVVGNLTITFNEAVRKIDDTPITNADLNTLIELKLTDNSGAVVPFSATIDVTKKIITIDPTTNLTANTTYYLEINPVEDAANNATTQNITFTTETGPVFTNSAPSGAPFNPPATCVGEEIRINANNFGNTPSVTVNGITVPVFDVVLGTSFKFTTLPGMIGNNLNVTVINNDNNLSSISTATININPVIETSLSIASNPLSPAGGQGYSILLGGVTQSSVTYRINENGGGYTSSTAGTGSQISLGSYNNPPGDYYYIIEASSAGCTTQYFPAPSPPDPQGYKVTIADLKANAGSDKSICRGGAGAVIGGSPSAIGGTGFHSYSWTPATGLSCTACPNPTANPVTTTTYQLVVSDNSPNTSSPSDVTVIVYPVPTAIYISLDSIKIGFSDQDSVYLLSNKVRVNPAGGTKVFSGLGVSKHADGKYYFDPKVVGTQTNMPIVFTYTAPSGCSRSATLNVNVYPADAVLGLDNAYCSNVLLSSPLTHNPTYIPASNASFTYSFSRLGFYDCTNKFMILPNPNNPLSLNASTPAPNDYLLDIQKIVDAKYPLNCYYIIVWVNQHNVAANTNTEIFTGYKYFQISNVGKPPLITSIRDSEYICSDNVPIKLTTNIAAYTTMSYTINDGPDNSITTSGPDYFFDPTKITTLTPGQITQPFTITYNYNDDNFAPAGGCSATVTRDFFVVNKVKAPTAPDQQYCQKFEGKRILSATSDIGSTDFYWYDGANDPVQGAVYNTDVSTALPTYKDYSVRQALFGCQGIADDVRITITPAPIIDLSIPPQCQDKEATFEGPTLNTVSWEWNLGDDILQYFTQTVKHVYKNPGVYTLSLLVKSNTGGQVCETKTTIPVTVGQNPKPNFGYKLVCDGDATQFAGTADILVDKYEWDFGDGNVQAKTTISNTAHSYSTIGKYTAYLKTYTNLGCYDSIVKDITILPYLTFTSSNLYEMNNVNGGDGSWAVEDLKDSTTWEFNVPNKAIIKSGTGAWVTNATGKYKGNDASVVNSPCLNIAGLEKPVLAFDYIANTQERQDGAALEYSINEGITWKSVGGFNSGLNWFNTPFFFTGNIGNSVSGWSGDILNINSSNDTTWVEAKRSLDNIPDLIPLASRKKVRFRMVFESDARAEFEGFAFKNLSIKKRNHTILVENFTNLLNSQNISNNLNFKSISGLETTKLQYHIAYPTDDVNTLVNKVDQMARAAYYGITNSEQLIPRGYVDGISKGNFITYSWVKDAIDTRSLVTSPFDTLIIETLPAEAGFIKVRASAIANTNIISGKLIFHIVVVEKTVNNDEYVVRKMLPSATGTLINLPIAAGIPIAPFELNWSVNSSQINLNNLAIVGFIQDEITGEVYQATILPNPKNLPTLVTGTEPTLSNQIAVYPNPANQSVTIQLPQAVRKQTPIKMFDVNGHEVHRSVFAEGERTKTIITQDFAAGVYLIQFDLNGAIVRKKVMVMHE